MEKAGNDVSSASVFDRRKPTRFTPVKDLAIENLKEGGDYAFFLSFFVICLVVSVQLTSAQEIAVPDKNLEKAIREALELPVGQALTEQQMLRLERLSAWDSEIADLTGLEHATFLIDLGLCGN